LKNFKQSYYLNIHHMIRKKRMSYFLCLP